MLLPDGLPLEVYVQDGGQALALAGLVVNELGFVIAPVSLMRRLRRSFHIHFGRASVPGLPPIDVIGFSKLRLALQGRHFRDVDVVVTMDAPRFADIAIGRQLLEEQLGRSRL